MLHVACASALIPGLSGPTRDASARNLLPRIGVHSLSRRMDDVVQPSTSKQAKFEKEPSVRYIHAWSFAHREAWKDDSWILAAIDQQHFPRTVALVGEILTPALERKLTDLSDGWGSGGSDNISRNTQSLSTGNVNIYELFVPRNYKKFQISVRHEQPETTILTSYCLHSDS